MIAVVAALLAAADASGQPIYVVTRVDSAIAADARVGTRKAGLLCVPSGPLRWQQIPFGKAEQRREIVRSALRDGGRQVASSILTGAGAKREVRVRAVVTTAGFDLCEQNGGTVRGDAAIATDWYLERGDATGAPRHLRLATKRRFDKADAVSAGEMFQALLRDAADEATRRLAADDAP